MVLNYIWVAFFVIAFVIAMGKFLLQGDVEIFRTLMDGIYETSKTAVDISLGMIGVMSLFLGFMKIAEKAGAIGALSKIISPFFSKLFPEIPKNHASIGHMMMNFSANLLGLDNAATPFGLKAMESLQELNPQKDSASNAQIMFLALHASGLTLIPVSIIAQRIILKSQNPTEIFLPCMITTFCATLVAMILVSYKQKINLLQPVVLAWLGGLSTLITGLMLFVHSLPHDKVPVFSSVFSNGLVLILFCTFIYAGLLKKINIYDSFVEGAKNGFDIAVKIIPYLVAMLVAISVFRNSGALKMITDSIAWCLGALGMNTDFVNALPTALMKPLSGSGARGMMIDTMKEYGPDSFVGRLSCIFNGTADTTFYVVALYFGSIQIQKTRYTIAVCLLADLAGILVAICMSYFFFK